MTNKSGLKPLGRAVLVRPDLVEEKTAGGIYIPRESVEKGQLAEQRATVVEVGQYAWRDEPSPRAKPGDRILFAKWAGYQAKGPADGELYRVVNDADIFMQITEEA
jgi:chaperonin GroES